MDPAHHPLHLHPSSNKGNNTLSSNNTSPASRGVGSVVGLTSLTKQNDMHELAKTLPPPRRQNVACDACRARKVRCSQLPGQTKCQHCISKNYACTHFVQQATSEKKRGSASRRARASNNAASSSKSPPPNLSNPSSGLNNNSSTNASGSGSTTGSGNPYGTPYALTLPYQLPNSRGATTSVRDATLQLLAYLFSPEGPTDPATSIPIRGRSPPTYHDWGELSARLESEEFRVEFALDLVEVFFQICHTRLPLLNPTHFRARLKQALSLPSSSPSDGTNATSPTLNGGGASVSNSSNNDGQSSAGGATNNNSEYVHPALLATVLAWGAKFSEHPLIVADRTSSSSSIALDDGGLGGGVGVGAGEVLVGPSRFARTLVNRAREVAEAEKVHRVSTVDHVVIALLIEPLQNQTPDEPDGFHGFWLTAAIRHLLFLQINHKSVMTNIQDPEARGTMIFAWWMACLADAYHSAYYRRKPQLDDDDYDIDFYTVDPLPPEVHDAQSMSLSPREQYEFLGYYRAAHALARIARHMSKQLWRPTTESDGIPFEVLVGIVTALGEWREEHLPRVGVPSDFESEWDFVSAVSACASDATYHVMWVILFNAVDDYGIKEFNEALRLNQHVQHHPHALSSHTHSHQAGLMGLGPGSSGVGVGIGGSSGNGGGAGASGMATPVSSPLSPRGTMEIESVKHKVLDEALHAALRIAGLTGVLTSNGYLKLDPAVMHFSCLTAGTLLARLGRPEVSNCIAGLKQYNYAYEEAGEEAIEMERVYRAVLKGESDIGHMTSVVAASGVGIGVGVSGSGAAGGSAGVVPGGDGMAVDVAYTGHQHHQHPHHHQGQGFYV